jgi:hypothetical protein
MPDFDAIGIALAARFASGVVTPPTGYDNVKVSTGDLPGQMYPLPCVLTFLDNGEFVHSAGKRDGVYEYTIRFYYNQIGDLERDLIALRKWATVLVDQLRLATQLAGIVTVARVATIKIGVLLYAGLEYSGIELGIHVNTNEPWAAVA